MVYNEQMEINTHKSQYLKGIHTIITDHIYKASMRRLLILFLLLTVLHETNLEGTTGYSGGKSEIEICDEEGNCYTTSESGGIYIKCDENGRNCEETRKTKTCNDGICKNG